MQIFFLITGLVILGSALMVVTTRNLIHAALWLIVTLFGVAVLYAILNASFLAVCSGGLYRRNRHPLYLRGHVDA